MITRKSDIPAWLFAEVAKLHAAGEPAEQVITLLRQNAVPKPYAMWILKKATGVSMAQAQLAVHHSEAYAERRASDEAFHDSVLNSLNIMDQQDRSASAA